MSELSGVVANEAETWWERLGLLRDPFSDQGPGFRFFPAQRKSVLAQLHHLARYSQLLLMVAGPAGSGKSILRQALMASTGKQAAHCLAMSARGCGDCTTMLARIAGQLGAASADLPAIMARVGEASLSGQEIYLLVDDAEHLAAETFAALQVLSVGAVEGRVHVFLFGESGSVDKLVTGDSAELCHVISLEPYGFEETVSYLAQRLESAGGAIDMIASTQLERIHRESAGWPGRINDLARDFLASESVVDAEPLGGVARSGAKSVMPWRSLVAAVCVGVAVLAAWAFNAGSSSVPPTQSVVGAAPGEKGEDRLSPGVAVRGGPVEFDGAIQQRLPLPLVGDVQPVVREPLAASITDERALASVDELEYESARAASTGALEGLREPGSTASAALPEPVAASDSLVAEPATSVATVSKPVAVVKASSVAVKPESTESVRQAPADWYQRQPSTSYLLQVLGTRSEQAAQALVRSSGADFHYFRKNHDGKPLYVVTYGAFANREQAVRAMERLPATLKSAKPWARRFGDVQREIRSAL